MSDKLLQTLIDAALYRGMDEVTAVVSEILAAGYSADDVIGAFIPDAARRMGQSWCDDGLGFAEVTIGSARLQRALRSVSGTRAPRNTGHTVLVIVPEDEHHTLGAMVAAEQMRRTGVSVRLCLGERRARLAQYVADVQYDAIFISLADPERLEDATRVVNLLRRSASNAAPIVVGGALSGREEEVRASIGADFAATDPFEGLRSCGLRTSRSARRPDGAAQRTIPETAQSPAR